MARATRYSSSTAAQGIVERAVHLVEIQVAGGGAGGLAAFAATARVDGLDEPVDVRGRQQTRAALGSRRRLRHR